MTSINDKYSKIKYQTLSNREIEEEYKNITSGSNKLSKIEVKNKIIMLNSISKERGFILPEFDMGQTTVNERVYDKQIVSAAATTNRKIRINYGKLIFGLISLGVGISILNTGLRFSYLLIIVGLVLIVGSTSDPEY